MELPATVEHLMKLLLIVAGNFIHSLQIHVSVQQGVRTHHVPRGQVPQLIPGPGLHTESDVCKQASAFTSRLMAETPI